MSAVYTSSSLLLIAALVGPASGAFPTRFVHHSRAHHPTHHLQELNQAMVDLQHAKAALAMKNGGSAAQHVAGAARQVEAAAQHHHTHHLAIPRTGVTGALAQALHHHHHGHLHQAIADMRAAEKQIAAGNHSAAVQDINRAETQIKEAVAFHHHVIGR